MLLLHRLVLRFGPWLCILAIAVLSLIPSQARPHTGLPGQLEHFLAYFLTAFLLGVQRSKPGYRAVLTIALCAYAGILETLQLWIPGRTAQLIDFAASSSGALSGMIVLAAFLSFWQSAHGKGS